MKFKEMISLGELAKASSNQQLSRSSGFEALEAKAIKVHQPGHFSGRNGYQERFLENVTLPLPGYGNKAILAQRLDGEGSVLEYQNFSIEIHRERKLALYTASNIEGSKSRRIIRTKSESWFLDGRIAADSQIGEDLYTENELDRGHLVRREDPVWGEKAEIANEDSFHFTNCSPQHSNFNQRTWLGLEDYILKNARVHQLRACVFTGPVFAKSDPEYRSVLLPQEYWKVVAIKTDGRLSATAYLLSQGKLLEGLEFVFGQYKTFQLSIREVEQLTGLTFHNLVEFDGFSDAGLESALRRQEISDWSQIRV